MTNITKVFRSTDTFRMNDHPRHLDDVPYKFISGLNVLGYKYDEEHDYHEYLLVFDENSNHLPNFLAEYQYAYDHLYVWNVTDDHWAVESESRSDLMSFFYRINARLFIPYYTRWGYKHYLVEWASENNKWGEYHTLMERWQSGNARDC